MSRSSGKGIGPVLVLGAIGVVGGIALFMALLAHDGERAFGCSQVAAFAKPRVDLIDRGSREELDAVSGPDAWHDAADQLGDLYAGLGADLQNRRLLPPSDPPADRDAWQIGDASKQVATRLRSLDGSLRASESLAAATAEMRDRLAAAEARCR